ncbi:MAG: ankyrin repeat domain-containing protein [Phycisphaerales bacterium]|nr:ankyrin repeat domain-containing protein [Phycisphaerales bacterium]
MAKKKRTLRIVRTLCVVFAVLVIASLVCFRPYVTVTVEHSLVGPADRAFSLLNHGVPFEEIKASVLASGKHVDEITWMNSSLLSRAAVKGRVDVATWLLEQGADPDGISPSTSPLCYAIQHENVAMVSLLLEHGADPDLDMGEGASTPRWLAIHFVKNQEIIDLLEKEQ